MSKFLASIPQGSSDEIQLHLSKVRGKETIDLRVYTTFPASETKVPTGRGLTFTKSEFEALKKTLSSLGDLK